jgi:hypothetical protein
MVRIGRISWALLAVIPVMAISRPGNLKLRRIRSATPESEERTRKAFYKFPSDKPASLQAVNADEDDNDDVALHNLLIESQASIPVTPPLPPPPSQRPTQQPQPLPETLAPTALDTPAPTALDTPAPKECVISVTIDCRTSNGTPCGEIEFGSGPDKCEQEIVQTYQIFNKGSDPVQLIRIDRTYNGETTDFLPFLRENPVVGGLSTFITGTTTVDACQEQDIKLGIIVLARPMGGSVEQKCEAESSFEFEIEAPQGRLNPTVSPTRRPPKPCTVEVAVACATVEDGTPCGELNDVAQGAACGAEGQERSIRLSYSIANTGKNDALTIKSANATYNDIQANVIPYLEETAVGPDDAVTTEQVVMIDLCQEKNFQFTFVVEAQSELGDDSTSCEDSAGVEFQIEGPPPSLAPSPMPVDLRDAPTQAPKTCELLVNITCTPPPGVEDCRSIPPAQEQCEGRPRQMGMLFKGGSCNQSQTSQLSRPDWYECRDFGEGPPTVEGTASYIVITARYDPSIVYHRGYVAVGDLYNLRDGGNLFVPDQNITIYSSDRTGPKTMLQTLVYHSSCTQNIFLMEQFGASQLVEWTNDQQGLVTAFARLSFVVSVAIGGTADSPVTLDSLISKASFGPTFNLSSRVSGFDLEPGSILQARIDATVDVSSRSRNSLLTTVTGKSDEATVDDGICRGVNFYSFNVEDQLAPASPTQAPSITPGPTPDPDTTPCLVAAEIRCTVLKKSIACDELAPPESAVCEGDGSPSELRFMYRSGSCSQSNSTSQGFNCTEDQQTSNSTLLRARVRISDPEQPSTVLFEGTVKRGEIFSVRRGGAELPDTVLVKLFTHDELEDPFQVLRIPIRCNSESSLSLLTNYGALQLTAFETSAQGFQSAIDEIEQIFVIRNDGRLVALVSWANITSALYGSNALVSPDPGLSVAPGLEYPFAFGSTQINLYTSSGQTYSSRLAVTASGLSSLNSLSCDASASLDLTVG